MMFKMLHIEDKTHQYNRLKDRMNEYLRDIKFDLVHAKNGDEAIVKFNSGNYDLLIVDISIPVKEGETEDETGGVKIVKNIESTVKYSENWCPIYFLSGIKLSRAYTKGAAEGLSFNEEDIFRKSTKGTNKLIDRIKRYLEEPDYKERELIKNKYSKQYHFLENGEYFSTARNFINIASQIEAKDSQSLKRLFLDLQSLLESSLNMIESKYYKGPKKDFDSIYLIPDTINPDIKKPRKIYAFSREGNLQHSKYLQYLCTVENLINYDQCRLIISTWRILSSIKHEFNKKHMPDLTMNMAQSCFYSTLVLFEKIDND